jgi:hypothetical protein
VRAERKAEFEVPLTSIGGPFEVPLRDSTFLDLGRGNSVKPEISPRTRQLAFHGAAERL